MSQDISSDAAFNVFHVDATGQKVPGSFILPFPTGGIELEPQSERFFASSVLNGRLYVYSLNTISGSANPVLLGSFPSVDTLGVVRNCEDLDLYTFFVGPEQKWTLAGHAASPTAVVSFDVSGAIKDSDSDGLPDAADSCPTTPNPQQTDSDGDGIGDACDSTNDADTDGVADYADNCPNKANASQSDADGDGIGDACDNLATCFGTGTVEALLNNQNNIVDGMLVDLDADGDQELVTLHNKAYFADAVVPAGIPVGTISIRWNGAHGSIGPLSQPVEFGVAVDPVALAVGDFNGDGYLDLASAHKALGSIAPSVWILLNDGNHHFPYVKRIEIPLTGGQRPEPVDLLAMNLNGAGGQDLLCVGRNPATFTAVIGTPTTPVLFAPVAANSAADGDPIRAITADFSNDGKDDVAVMAAAGAVWVYRHRTDFLSPYLMAGQLSNLSPSSLVDLCAARLRSAVAVPDIVVATTAGTTRILQNISNGSSFNVLTAQSITSGQIRRLSRWPTVGCGTCTDAVAALINEPAAPWRTASVQYLPAASNGSGTFDLGLRRFEVVNSSVDATSLLIVGHLDNKVSAPAAALDMVVANKIAPLNDTRLPMLRIQNPFRGGGSYALNDTAIGQSIAMADFDGFNGPDIVVANKFSPGGSTLGSVQLFKQQALSPSSNQRFVDEPQQTLVVPSPYSDQPVFAVASGPINGDTAPDVAYTYVDLDVGAVLRVHLNLNNGTGLLDAGLPNNLLCSSCGEPRALVLANIDADTNGRLDAAVAIQQGSNNLLILSGVGDGTFAAPSTVQVGGDPVAVALCDLNGDGGPPDIVTANASDGTVTVLQNQSTGGNLQFATPIAPLQVPGPSPDLRSIASGRDPCNGLAFVALADFTNDRAVVFRQISSGSFDTGTVYSVLSGPQSISILDFNGDGADDIVTANNGDDSLSVLLNDGSGNFTSQPRISSGPSVRAVSVADMDGNGRPDIVHAGGSDAPNEGDSFVRVTLNDCGCTTACIKGDVNLGGGIVPVNGLDIQPFIQHLYAGTATGQTLCAADVSGDCTHSTADIQPFVCRLLGSPAGCLTGGCPNSQAVIAPPDCDSDGTADSEEIANGAMDCNTDGVPDECQLYWADCNSNGILDACDVDASDPDHDGIVHPDCNNSGIPDSCDLELVFLPSYDCNTNGIPDECDIASSYSQDADSNGIPDECDEGGQQMMGQSGGGQGEGSTDSGDASNENSSDSETGGGIFDNPAWADFFDWQFNQQAALSAMSAGERFQATRDKLRELGLPEAIPWARVQPPQVQTP